MLLLFLGNWRNIDGRALDRMKEKTIKKVVSCEGLGLHTGQIVRLSLLPAGESQGVVFIRKDLARRRIPVTAEHVVPSQLSTRIEADGVSVQTVEHLLAAVSALEIDNLIIELDGPEVPAMDGSAAPYISLLLEAGIASQKKNRSYIEILKAMSVFGAGKSVSVQPGSSFEISYRISYEHPLIAEQSYRYWHSRHAFINEIASARTFAFLKDVAYLKSQGLAMGGSLDNAVVIGEDAVLNEQGLRYRDEFVRHKILDLIGDFSLLGMPVLGRIEANCSGHKLHAEMVQSILKNKKAWRVVTAPSSSRSFRSYPTLNAVPLAV